MPNMLRTTLFAILFALALAGKEVPPTNPPATTEAASGDGGNNGSGGGGPAACVPAGTGSAIIALNLGSADLKAIPVASFATAHAIAAALATTQPECVTTFYTGTDKNGISVIGYSATGLSAAMVTAVSGITGPSVPYTTLFGFDVSIYVTNIFADTGLGGNGDGEGKEKITKDPPRTEYIPQIDACTSTATGAVTFTIVLPGYQLVNFNVLRVTNLRNYFATILSTSNGCVMPTNIAYDTANNALIDVQIIGLTDADTAAGLIVANEKTNLINTAFEGNSLTISNLVSRPDAPKKEDPPTPAPTTTPTTAPFDYYTLLPQIVANIDVATGTMNAEFQQRIISGCQGSRQFCNMAMNVMTAYMATIAQWKSDTSDAVDKEGTQYSTQGGSSSGLSMASVLAITGGALAAVVVAAMVVAKMKTGRFVPLRPSSRVSISSDTRTLTAQTSRISVRAWPNAMEV